MKLTLPKNEKNEEYWVPITCKNKDFLLGAISAKLQIEYIIEEKINYFIDFLLGSDRYKDINEFGQRMGDMSEQEIIEYVKQGILEDLESETYRTINKCSCIYDDYILNINCTCGNFYGFKTENEIPDDDFSCDICGKKLIFYTNLNDSEIEFDGKQIDMEKIQEKVLKIINDLGEKNE